MGFDLGELAKFVERNKEIKELKAKQSKLQEANDKVEEQIIDGMLEAGLKNRRIGDRLLALRGHHAHGRF